MSPSDGPPEDLRAIGRLPGGLEVEIRHRRAAAGPEQVVVSVTAPAGFEAWAGSMAASHPVLAWMQFAEAAWAPWFAMLGLPRPRLPGGPPRG